MPLVIGRVIMRLWFFKMKENNRLQHIKETPLKHCDYCGIKLERKRFPNGDLESLFHFIHRKYCDQKCMGLMFDSRPSQSTDWSTTHYHARKLVPAGLCEECGKPDATDVHNKDGNHQNNLRSNLERICRSCHNRHHRQKGLCKICGIPQKGRGYCVKHLVRFKKYGDPLLTKDNQFTPIRKETELNPVRICKVIGCLGKYHANGYCGKHAI